MGSFVSCAESTADGGPLAVILFTYPDFSSHGLWIVESPLLPEPSMSVFLGILRKTLGVDPGMTPCPVPGL